mmetsp:Transcript_1178/g.2931  ORF Transcript_1178/g.2931 Transcript_1178/m.2931 type:complete len:348 (+) Transcript_1178:110-1153(+)
MTDSSSPPPPSPPPPPLPSIDTSSISQGRASVTPNLLLPRQISALRADARALYTSGAFVPGGLRRKRPVENNNNGRGNSTNKNRNKKRRTSSSSSSSEGGGSSMKTTTDDATRICDVCGLFDDAEKAGPGVGDMDAREDLFDLMGDLRDVLQRELDVRLSEGMELQYLRYPGAACGSSAGNGDDKGECVGEKRRGFYGRHFDSAADDETTSRRKISLLLYLNDDTWDGKKDGGILRAYVRKPTKKRKTSGIDNIVGAEERDIVGVQDIVPRGGKLVLFDSASVEHEVLPTMKERWAVVGWFLSEEKCEMRGQSGDRRGGMSKNSLHRSCEDQCQPRKKKKKKRRRGR